MVGAVVSVVTAELFVVVVLCFTFPALSDASIVNEMEPSVSEPLTVYVVVHVFPDPETWCY